MFKQIERLFPDSTEGSTPSLKSRLRNLLIPVVMMTGIDALIYLVGVFWFIIYMLVGYCS